MPPPAAQDAQDVEARLARLRFFTTSSFPCPYLPGQQERSQAVTPEARVDTATYAVLARLGFRRSGAHIYRPRCDACAACVPVRLPVARLVPDRSQRRALRRHAGLQVQATPLHFDAAHYALYVRYQASRHPGGSMDGAGSRASYLDFLLESDVDTCLVAFSDATDLRMVSVVDTLDDGLSAVYTFYDPDRPGASYGTYGILWLAEWARSLGLPYLYLGYWIRGSEKMAYKANFRPLQGRVEGVWRELSAAELGRRNETCAR
ncbi:MAG: arginyltransferase [Zoogloeaceae bacterium]|nr:arginyltransferase [Zoogloeaceae bacterium]